MATSLRVPARRRFKRVLTVRQLAAQTAWLDSSARWHEGRVVWPFVAGAQIRRQTPGAAELSVTERALKKIQHYPRAADIAFGDGAAWLEARYAKLDIVKRLCRVEAPDLPLLNRASHARNPATTARLTELLVAEALCRNDLPISPAKALVRIAGGQTALEALLLDGELPMPVRALAALVLGARKERLPDGLRGAEPWLRSAWRYGEEHGLPEQPALAAHFLSDKDGASLMMRFERAVRALRHFSLPYEMPRELLDAGTSAEAVVSLFEAVAACVPLITRFVRTDVEALKQRYAPKRQQAALDALHVVQAELASSFTELIQDFATEGDSQLVWAVRSWLLAWFEREHEAARLFKSESPFDMPWLRMELQTALARHALLVLRQVLKMPPTLRITATNILNDYHKVFWHPLNPWPNYKIGHTEAYFEHQLASGWYKRVRYVFALLNAAGVDLTCEALLRNAAVPLGKQQWHDPQIARWAVTLAEEFIGDENRFTSDKFADLCYALARYNRIGDARAALMPLVEALRGAPQPARERLFLTMLERFPQREMRSAVPRLLPIFPLLTRSLADVETWQIECIFSGALILEGELRQQVPSPFIAQETAEEEGAAAYNSTFATWIEWMLADLRLTSPEDDEAKRLFYSVNFWMLDTTVRLSVLLAQGDFAAFQKLFPVAARYDFPSSERLESAVWALRDYPALWSALASEFPRQPARCAPLLLRLGLVRRLGADVLQPLDVFREVPSAIPLVWRELFVIAPEAWLPAAQLWQARLLMGQDASLPPGVRHALELPRKLAGELAHIEKLYTAQPGRSDLAKRAETLRRRLSDEAGLRAAMAETACESLLAIAAEAQLVATQTQILACYRERLRDIVGPLPDDFPMSDDWLNAVLLGVDIERNRKLLRELMRACRSGEHEWREKQPANVAFLEELRVRGVDTVAWLSAFPKRFRCRGGHVHLRFEKDPLSVLQMGNYFDTCLSFGGVNSFSTVANACELNKRVVYARDDSGRVVGRKLIGLNESGHLIGFYTYTSLKDEAANRELRAIFSRYCEEFAARCGLTLAQNGTVPKLFAQAWYDDGVVDWQDVESKDIPSPGSARLRKSVQR